MAKKNAKSQALRVWRDQKVSNSINHLNRNGEVEGDGTRLENQPIGTGREDCTGHNSGCRLGGTTVGGILRELIDEVDEQSAYHSSQASYHNSQLERLSDRRRHLQQLYQELQAQTEEGGDVESDDDEELEDNE
ncbi:MAG TPA: hypothetical protein V6C91_03785 [Coleofasciculaceae cyanobacterium]